MHEYLKTKNIMYKLFRKVIQGYSIYIKQQRIRSDLQERLIHSFMVEWEFMFIWCKSWELSQNIL